jgi:hypothetical protein
MGQKQRKATSRERNRQLTDFAGLREMVIAHNAALRARQPSFETMDDEDRQLTVFFAG